jgi:acetyl-CoA/propionyl-CoA carboxylase biotin carboxyl carrier protein
VLPFHRAVIDHADFVGSDGFNVHTRWIESDFAEPLAAAARAEPQQDDGLLRTAIEVDGRRMVLGLPAQLLRGLADAPAGSAAEGTAGAQVSASNPAELPSPIAGTVQAWKVALGDEVKEGDLIAVMEAMKMEMQVHAHRDGRVVWQADAGTFLAAGARLAEIA